jgi:hypothetical protein
MQVEVVVGIDTVLLLADWAAAAAADIVQMVFLVL